MKTTDNPIRDLKVKVADAIRLTFYAWMRTVLGIYALGILLGSVQVYATAHGESSGLGWFGWLGSAFILTGAGISMILGLRYLRRSRKP